MNLETADGAERLAAALVSGNFFPLLGTRPAAGRLLQPGDDVRPGGHPVVVPASPSPTCAPWRPTWAVWWPPSAP